MIGYALFLPILLLYLASMAGTAYHSWEIRERAGDTPWYPPLYPLKWMIAVALGLLLLQSLAELVRAGAAARRPSTP